MKSVKRIAIVIALLPAIYFASCRKGNQATWDTQILAPLVKTTLSVNNLVTTGAVNSNPADSAITLVFSDSLYNLNTDSLFKIPDTTLVYNYPAPISGSFGPGDTIIPSTSNNSPYNTGSGVELKRGIIQSGWVKVDIMSTVKGMTDFYYKVPSLTLNGIPFYITQQVPAATSSGGTHIIKYYPLNGYTIDLTGPTHNNYNTISTILKGILDPLATTTTVNPGDGVFINISFDSLVPYFGGGYFGKTTKNIGPDTSTFSLFKKFTAGSLQLKNANVTFTLENGFGVDAQILLKQLTAITRSGNPVQLSDAAIINNPININRAVETYNPANPVNPSIKTFSITPSNSNILAWIDSLPVRVAYALQVTTDPLGNVSGSTDFAYLNHGIKAYLNVTIPLSLIATNLTLADTVGVNLASSDQAKQIKSGVFTLYATNGFPFSAGMQVYVLNSNNQVSDSLVVPAQSILSGLTDATGKVIATTTSSITIPVSTVKMPNLLAAKKLIIMARFNTPSVFCQIYSYYTLSVKLVGNFDYQVKG